MALEKATADGQEDLNQQKWVDSISFLLDIFALLIMSVTSYLSPVVLFQCFI